MLTLFGSYFGVLVGNKFDHAKRQMHPAPSSPVPPPLAFPSPREVDNTRFRAFEKKTRYGRTDGRMACHDRPDYRDEENHLVLLCHYENLDHRCGLHYIF